MKNTYKKFLWGLLIVIVMMLIAYGAAYYSMKENLPAYPGYGDAPATSTLPFYASSTETTTSTKIRPSLVMELNKPVQVEDVTATVLAVMEDSRCPTNVQCVWAGRVKVSMDFRSKQKDVGAEIGIGGMVSINGINFTLLAVDPYPVSGHKTQDGEYRFTFKTEHTKTTADAKEGCFVGGCSGQICSNDPNALSTCEYSESYACYKSARCERQADGQCGWTETDSLKACLSKSGSTF
jgi:hypothetical protein